MSIEHEVQKRKMALELFELFDEFEDEHWEKLRDVLIERYPLAPPKQQDERDSEEHAKSIGSTTLIYGLHKGKRVDAVPIDYLDWLCGSCEDTAKELKAYLKYNR